MINKIHIWDFPEDKIVVFLEDEFRAEFIDSAISSIGGSRELSSFLGLRKTETINRWKIGEINRGKGWITPQGIPLNHIKKLSNLVVSQGFKQFNMITIERNIVCYKSKGKSLLVKNPILPIKESPELFRLISHMLGDGSAEENNVNYYKNTDNVLLQDFVSDIGKVFGDIQFSVNKDNVVFPITVRHILHKYYEIPFGTFDGRFPNTLFRLPEKFAASFIQGFFDDEGNFDSSCLRFYSYNKQLIEGVRLLLIKRFPGIKGINIVRNRTRYSQQGKLGIEYSFSIRSIGLKEFYSKIGCRHAIKNEKFQNYFHRKGRKWNHRKPNMTKKLIVEELNKGPKTTYQLSKSLNVSETSVRTHIQGYSQRRKQDIKGLNELGYVNSNKRGKYGRKIWTCKGI